MVGNPRDAKVGTARYCSGCKVTHTSSGWYSDTAGLVCRKTYRRKLCHRCVKVKCEHDVIAKQDRHTQNASVSDHLLLNVDTVDCTGHRICSLAGRADIQAMLTARTLLTQFCYHSPSLVVVLLGFLHILYWSFPVLAAVEKMRAADVASCFDNPKELYKKLASIKRSLVEEFSEVIVMDGGALIPREAKQEWAQECEHGFAHPLQNPSERRSVDSTLDMLLDDIDNGSWPRAATFIANALELKEWSIHALSEGLQKCKCSMYSGGLKNYTSIRFLRTLLSIYHIEPMDSEEDWKTLRTMSCHVKAKLTKLNIKTHADALQARDHMRSALKNNKYSLNDLTTYVCLMPA